MTLSENIVKAARSFLGQREKPGNSGFVDENFERLMKTTGWHSGDSWCVFAAELVWKTGFKTGPTLPPAQLQKLFALDKLFSGSAIATWANFKASKLFQTGQVPKPGALAIWQHGNTWQGHAGVVESVAGDGNFFAIEGNGSEAGSREGTTMVKKYRKTKEAPGPGKLNLLGFVYPE